MSKYVNIAREMTKQDIQEIIDTLDMTVTILHHCPTDQKDTTKLLGRHIKLLTEMVGVMTFTAEDKGLLENIRSANTLLLNQLRGAGITIQESRTADEGASIVKGLLTMLRDTSEQRVTYTHLADRLSSLADNPQLGNTAWENEVAETIFMLSHGTKPSSGADLASLFVLSPEINEMVELVNKKKH